jgi:hypothetical protein
MSDPVNFFNIQLGLLQFSFTEDSTWRDITVPAAVASTDCTAVLLRVRETNVNNPAPTLGAREKDGSYSPIVSQSPLSTSGFIVPIIYEGSNAVFQAFDQGNASTTWAYQGALYGEGWVKSITPRTLVDLSWETFTVNLQGTDVASDVEGVLLHFVKTGNDAIDFGARKLGGTGFQEFQSSSFLDWVFLPVDEDGKYQIYRGTVPKNNNLGVSEVYYIKKGYGIVAIDGGDNNFLMTGGSNAWKDDDLTDEVPDTATRAFVAYNHKIDGGLAWRTDGVRVKVNLTGTGGISNIQRHMVGTGVRFDDADRKIQTYNSFNDNTDVYVNGYYDPSRVTGRGGNRQREYTNFNQERFT